MEPDIAVVLVAAELGMGPAGWKAAGLAESSYPVVADAGCAELPDWKAARSAKAPYLVAVVAAFEVELVGWKAAGFVDALYTAVGDVDPEPASWTAAGLAGVPDVAVVVVAVGNDPGLIETAAVVAGIEHGHVQIESGLEREVDSGEAEDDIATRAGADREMLGTERYRCESQAGRDCEQKFAAPVHATFVDVEGPMGAVRDRCRSE